MGFTTFEHQDRILVALSGGVDSSVCVHILRSQGFAVEAAVIRFSDVHDSAVQAAQVAADQLGIRLHVIHGEEAFDQHVALPFCRSYCSGETPNPCVVCNPMVKFRLLAEKADELGIRLIATGHYARIGQDEDGFWRVHNAESSARDQSYMLYRLGQDILSRLVMPLGEFEKPMIREMAADLGLASASAPDSMEICFIPDGDRAGYIEGRGFHSKEGHFIGPAGQDLGPHKGVLNYTVGQRKRLGIALGKPLFVQSIEESGNIQLAFSGDEFFSSMVLRDMASASGKPLPAGEYLVKIRSAAKPIPCQFNGVDTVTFPEPVRAPAPGQSAVFYRDDALMGGGFIARTE